MLVEFCTKKRKNNYIGKISEIIPDNNNCYYASYLRQIKQLDSPKYYVYSDKRFFFNLTIYRVLLKEALLRLQNNPCANLNIEIIVCPLLWGRQNIFACSIMSSTLFSMSFYAVEIISIRARTCRRNYAPCLLMPSKEYACLLEYLVKIMPCVLLYRRYYTLCFVMPSK